jgi:hypothetical protein
MKEILLCVKNLLGYAGPYMFCKVPDRLSIKYGRILVYLHFQIFQFLSLCLLALNQHLNSWKDLRQTLLPYKRPHNSQRPVGLWGHRPVGADNDQVIFFVSVLFCFEKNSWKAKIAEKSNKISEIYNN